MTPRRQIPAFIRLNSIAGGQSEDTGDIVAVNVKGIYLASKYVVPIMINQKSRGSETRGLHRLQGCGLLSHPSHAG